MSVKLKQVFSGKRLDEVHALYETAFPASEKKPFSMIVSGQGTGLVEILSLEENNRFLGLAIMAKAGDRVLLDYFAIADEVRGHGAGSAALQALRERYQGMRIIIEIESTKCVDEEELTLRTRRKKFYLRNGFTMLPYYIDLWGTEMEMLSNGQPCPYEEYLDIYTTAFGTKVSDKIHFLGDAPRQMRSDGSLGAISEEIRIKFTKSTQGYDIVSDK